MNCVCLLFSQWFMRSILFWSCLCKHHFSWLVYKITWDSWSPKGVFFWCYFIRLYPDFKWRGQSFYFTAVLKISCTHLSSMSTVTSCNLIRGLPTILSYPSHKLIYGGSSSIWVSLPFCTFTSFNLNE